MPTPISQDIDVTRTLHIHQSWPKLAGFAAFFGVLTLICAVALMISAESSVGMTGVMWVLFLSGAFFAVSTLYFAARSARGRARVITLSPEGYRDTSTHNATIPWSEITRIKATVGRGAHLRLWLTGHMAAALALTGIRRFTHLMLKGSAKPVLTTNANTLEMGLERLHHLTTTYAAAHGGPRNEL